MPGALKFIETANLIGWTVIALGVVAAIALVAILLKEKRAAKLVLVGAALCSLGACSTIIHGSTQDVEFVSEPPGAFVEVDGKHAGTTPCEVELKRKQTHTATLTHPRYPNDPRTFRLEPHFNGATLGNLLLGGIIGIGVDAASGANYSLSPDPVIVTWETPKEVRP